MTDDTVLLVDGVSVYYGFARALSQVSLEVRKGSCTAVLGANGAGKTTLARAISGMVPLREGSIYFKGETISGWPVHRTSRAGLLHAPSEKLLFPGLSVEDNMRMAIRLATPRSQRAETVDRMLEVFPALSPRRKQIAGTLSGGEQQMLSLARVLVVPPELLIVDELSHGLAPIIVEKVFDALRSSLELGVTIVVIEQFVNFALTLADQAVILRRGEVMWSGPSHDASSELTEHYMGT